MDDLVSPIRAVCTLDPAIDFTDLDLSAYIATRDASMVRELPGRSLVWYVVQPLSADAFFMVEGASNAGLKIRTAFGWGVVAIESLRPGERMEPQQRVKGPDGRSRGAWSSSELAEIAETVGMRAIIEIGSLIYERALLGKAAGGTEPYSLPQSSQHALEMIARRHAERIQETATTP